jgi:glycosyltransferase involved in cell wall biosynthesis
MDLSIVIPLLNEEESLPELLSWIHRVCADNYSYEVVAIDDGSQDDSWEVLKELKSSYPNLKAIRFQRNYGKSAALNEGFKLASGNVVVTIDADLQDSPEEIPELYRMITEEGIDLVSGWKKERHDPISKTVPSKFFNWVTRKMSGIELNDFNCGLKAYRKKVVKSIEVYGEMHRYIPILAKQAGFNVIEEKVVRHQARKYGVTKFGIERFLNGFLDLLSVSFMAKFSKRPMHFFGLYGTLFFILGAVLAVYILGQKAYALYYLKEPATLVADNPIFYLGLVTMVIGVQLFLAGFLGELITRSAPDRNSYLVDEYIGFPKKKSSGHES